MFSSLFSRDLCRPVAAVAAPPSDGELVKKVRDVFKKYFDDTLGSASLSQGREVLRLKRLLDTIEVAALIERQAQEQSAKSESGAPTGAFTSVEAGTGAAGTGARTVALTPLKRSLTIFPYDKVLHAESFVNDLLDDAQTLYGLSSVFSAPSARAPPNTPTAAKSVTSGEECGEAQSCGDGDEGDGEVEMDEGEIDLDADTEEDDESVDAPLQLNLSIPASLWSGRLRAHKRQ